MANWGFTDDQGSPQIYDANRRLVYAELDAAAAGAKPQSAKPSPVSTWEQVIYGCPGPNGPAGDEPNANQSDTDFQMATGQAPPYLTDFHALGDHSLASCG